eukprot:CFRG8348T1
MSSVHYKFQSTKTYSTVTFDGMAISLKDLKLQISEAKRFGKVTDMDLKIINAQTNVEYTNNNELIPKNTSVIVQRKPVMSGRRIHQPRSDTQSDPTVTGTAPPPVSNTSVTMASSVPKTAMSEEERLKSAMTKMTADAGVNEYINKGTGPRGPMNPYMDRNTKPAPTYICYRCGKPGHWIKFCPNDKGESLNVKVMKPTTGIPKSFLKYTTDGETPGALMTEDGKFAVVQPNEREFTKVMKQMGPTNKSAENGALPDELKCQMCQLVLKEVVTIPCCNDNFCDECIRTYLLENNFTCPSCFAERVSPDALVPNKSLRKSVQDYISVSSNRANKSNNTSDDKKDMKLLKPANGRRGGSRSPDILETKTPDNGDKSPTKVITDDTSTAEESANNDADGSVSPRMTKERASPTTESDRDRHANQERHVNPEVHRLHKGDMSMDRSPGPPARRVGSRDRMEGSYNPANNGGYGEGWREDFHGYGRGRGTRGGGQRGRGRGRGWRGPQDEWRGGPPDGYYGPPQGEGWHDDVGYYHNEPPYPQSGMYGSGGRGDGYDGPPHGQYGQRPPPSMHRGERPRPPVVRHEMLYGHDDHHFDDRRKMRANSRGPYNERGGHARDFYDGREEYLEVGDNRGGTGPRYPDDPTSSNRRSRSPRPDFVKRGVSRDMRDGHRRDDRGLRERSSGRGQHPHHNNNSTHAEFDRDLERARSRPSNRDRERERGGDRGQKRDGVELRASREERNDTVGGSRRKGDRSDRKDNKSRADVRFVDDVEEDGGARRASKVRPEQTQLDGEVMLDNDLNVDAEVKIDIGRRRTRSVSERNRVRRTSSGHIDSRPRQSDEQNSRAHEDLRLDNATAAMSLDNRRKRDIRGNRQELDHKDSEDSGAQPVKRARRNSDRVGITNRIGDGGNGDGNVTKVRNSIPDPIKRSHNNRKRNNNRGAQNGAAVMLQGVPAGISARLSQRITRSGTNTGRKKSRNGDGGRDSDEDTGMCKVSLNIMRESGEIPPAEGEDDNHTRRRRSEFW